MLQRASLLLCTSIASIHIAPDFDVSRDGLVGLHVEALNGVGAIDLGEEARVERDDDRRAHKDT